MGRISTVTNPTNLVKIDRSRISVSVIEAGADKLFVLNKLDLSGLSLPGPLKDLRVVCYAKRGNTRQRFDLGSPDALNKAQRTMKELDHTEPLRFRFLVHRQGDHRLVASAEQIKPENTSNAEGLFPMEGLDLGERLWSLDITEDGPVLFFNSNVFQNAASAENCLPFAALVIPEALNQILLRIARNPSCLEDENDSLFPWKAWLESRGANFDAIGEDEAEQRRWSRDFVDGFCRQYGFATKLLKFLTKENS